MDESATGPGRTIRPSATWGAILWCTVLGCVLLGQYLLANPQLLGDGAVFVGLGVVLFVGLAARRERWPSLAWASRGPLAVRRASLALLANPVPAVLIAAGVGASFFTIRILQAPAQTPQRLEAVPTWLAGIALVAAGCCWPSLRAGAWRAIVPAAGWRSWARVHRFELATIAGVTVLAALIRIVGLGTLPSVVDGDEGRIGALTLDALKGGFTLFGTIFGHSTLYLYLRAIPYALFGADPLNFANLRLVEAVTATVTVPAVYLLGRELFDRRVATVAAVLLAVSHIHIHFSRIAVTGATMDAFFVTVTLLCFAWGLRRGSVPAFAAAGLLGGTHLYIYMGARLVFLFLLVAVVVLAVVDRRLVRRNLAGLGAFLLMFAVVGAPMLLWIAVNPSEFNARFNQVGVIQGGWLAAEAQRTGSPQWRIMLDQLRKSILSVFYFPANGFYMAKLPMLDRFTAAPFLLGAALALVRTFEPRFLLLNGWVWSTLVAGQMLLMLPEHGAYRVLMLVPAACILAGVGWVRLLDLAPRSFVDRRTFAGLTAALLLAAAYTNLNFYFFDWNPSCVYPDRPTRLASVLGTYMGRLDRDRTVYLYGEPSLVYGIHPSVDFMSRKLPAVNVPIAQGSSPTAVVKTNTVPVFVFTPERFSQSDVVEAAYPGGTWRDLMDCGNVALRAYEVPAS